MAFNLGDMMERKQDRECGRLDAFEFARRARYIRLIAEWVAPRSSAVIDPVAAARRIVREKDEMVMDDLRRQLSTPLADTDWTRITAALSLLADAETRIDLGNPEPYRLA